MRSFTGHDHLLGCALGEEVMCEDNTTIRWDTTIGPYTKLVVGRWSPRI